MSKFIPRPYQNLIIGHILTHPRCALYVSMGMGKTSSTLAALAYLKTLGEPVRALVLAPLRVARLEELFTDPSRYYDGENQWHQNGKDTESRRGYR